MPEAVELPIIAAAGIITLCGRDAKASASARQHWLWICNPTTSLSQRHFRHQTLSKRTPKKAGIPGVCPAEACVRCYTARQTTRLQTLLEHLYLTVWSGLVPPDLPYKLTHLLLHFQSSQSTSIYTFHSLQKSPQRCLPTHISSMWL